MVRKVNLNSDAKVKEIAKILVNHSCQIKKGEYVQIVAGIPARPLILELEIFFEFRALSFGFGAQ